MDLFNKTFFRLAFGFIAIVLTSVMVILLTNAFMQSRSSDTVCVMNCAK